MDTLTERAQTELPLDIKPRHDALNFLEQHISVVISQKKVTSRLPLHISNMIHGPTLRTYTLQKEGWYPHIFQSIAWDSFAVSFNKLTSAQQIIVTKKILSFWCSNHHHRCDRGQLKYCCFCGAQDGDR
jgi:hypothetical protein